MSQVAINWCICKGTVPIPGAKSLAQAEENLGALGWRLAASEEAALDAAGLAARRCHGGWGHAHGKARLHLQL